MKESEITVPVAQFVIQMPVLAAWPDPLFCNPEKRWLTKCQCPRDPVGHDKDTMRFFRVTESLEFNFRDGIRRCAFPVAKPFFAFLPCTEAHWD